MPLHSPKVTVWCAIFEFGVQGLYFFEEDDVTVTVTSDRYCAMLENLLRPKLDIFSMNMEQKMCGFNVWCNSPHISFAWNSQRNISWAYCVSLRGDIGWLPHSPELTPCDFFSVATLI
jgi:hypothetical protein